jgi:hypothetical protein
LPTAQQAVLETQLIPDSTLSCAAGASAEATTFQVLPFQCTVRARFVTPSGENDPTAQQSDATRQVTPCRTLDCSLALGESTSAHPLPPHRTIIVFAVLAVVKPTAQHCDADVQVTLLKPFHGVVPMLGDSTIVQALPFHRMMRDRTWTSLVMYEPTAQHSDEETHVTSARMFANTPWTFGEGTVRHVLPSHLIVTVEPRPDRARPTAQQSAPLMHDTPVRMFGSALAFGESTVRHEPGF